MSLKVLLLRGTETQNDAYTGKDGELTIDITTRSLRIHDGVKVGGHPVLGDAQIQSLVNDLGTRIDDNDDDLTTVNSTLSDIQLALEDKLDSARVGQSDGVASLDSNGKLPLSQLSDTVLGQVIYQGTWNASTNTPTIPDVPLQKGDYYVASTAGSFSGMEFQIGDWVISNGEAWEKVDNTDSVKSVAGKAGVVTLDKSDVGLANASNTSDANKPVSIAQQTALDKKVNQSDYDTFKDSVEAMDTGVSSVTGTGSITVDNANSANPKVGISDATPSQSGAMSKADKVKLNDVEEGAQANTVESVAGRTGAVTLSKGDVGLDGVENYAMASDVEGEAGDSGVKYASPKTVRSFVEGMGFSQAGGGEWTLDQGSM